MKKMKKLLAILMTMAMVMGLGITGFAAEEGTNVMVTVDNIEGADLYVAQIVKANTSNPDGWEYVTEYASAFSGITIVELASIAKGTENGNADSTNEKLTSSTKLAQALENVRTNIEVEKNKKEGNSFTANSGGLYVVVPVKEGYTYTPTLVYVPVGSTEAQNVATKGAEDQIKKEITAGGESVQAGDSVEYTVTANYPYVSENYTNPTFTITDTLTNATFGDVNDIIVSGMGTKGTDYKVELSNGNKVLNVTMLRYDGTKAGDQITIQYSVTVDDTVSADGALQNKVDSNLQIDTDKDPIKTEYKVVSTPVKATINKVDTSETPQALMGAVFAIYKGNANDDEEDTLVSIVADATSVEDITLPEEFEDNADLLKADGNQNGEVVFDGLDGQENYYVVEVIAPNGYKIDKTPHQLIQGGVAEGYPKKDVSSTSLDGTTKILTTTYKYNDFKVNKDNNNIANTTLSALPETGGMGTTIFTIAGCVIMISAAGLFFATRKKAN